MVFFEIIIVFYSIAVSTLAVCVYGYRVSADDFPSKSRCPEGLRYLGVTE